MSSKTFLKVLPIFLLSLSVNAGFLSDIKGKFFGTEILVFIECVDNLEKKGVSNHYNGDDEVGHEANKLCIDKYADTVPLKNWSYKGSSANTKATITLQIQNNSKYAIKKIEYSGEINCNKTKVNEGCENQSFDGVLYPHPSINPNSNRSTSSRWEFWLPDDIKKGEWGWRLHSDKMKAYGFILDY